MDDPPAVRIVKRIADLQQKIDGKIRAPSRIAGGRDVTVERLPLDQFHGDINKPVLFVDIENRNDAGVRQAAGGLRLAEQPLPQVLDLVPIGLVGRLDRFDRHFAADSRIAGAVNNAHRPPPQLRSDLVTTDLFH